MKFKVPCCIVIPNPSRIEVTYFAQIVATYEPTIHFGFRNSLDTGLYGWEAENAGSLGDWSAGRAKHPSQPIGYVLRARDAFFPC